MQPDERPQPWRVAAAAAALAWLLAACASLGGAGADSARNAATPGVDRDTQLAAVLAGTIQDLQRLASASTAEQAEMLARAQAAYLASPGGGAQLRYALALATPGHQGRDAARARDLLRELAAQPERLAPAERALALLELAQLERELGLLGDNARLQGALARNQDQERLAVATRRLQAELEENSRLRHALEEAQAKLDAIANIERNSTEHKTAPGGKKP
jgi:hypothetical protein